MKMHDNHQQKTLSTQLQELVSDLTEQEQEMISGFGESYNVWLNDFSIRIENQESQKNWLGNNFRVTSGDLATHSKIIFLNNCKPDGCTIKND
ncbi:MAG: hypothetical protein Fur006_49270 [Coleofasciculaceae cyanobacterium]